MTHFGVRLSCYVYVFAISTYLTTVNQCLTTNFFQKLYVTAKISIRCSEKKYQTIEKVEMSKMPMVNPFFSQIIVYT